MNKAKITKPLAVAIILLFIGVSVIPSTGIFVDNNPINSTNADDPVEYWGVFINEGLGAYTLLSYWREILCTHGWEENHLHLVISDNLTKKMVKDAIFWLDEREDSNDISLVYIGAHGYPGFFHLSNGRMSYWELNREINRLESDGIFILLDPCYSGSAIPFLRKRGRVILTACKANEESIGFEGVVEFGLFGIADNIGNDNGMVSAEELYGYTTRIPLDSDIHPQMSDKYRGDLNLVFVHLDDRRIDQKQVEFDFGAFPISVGGEDFIAQSFIPYSSKITKIKLGVSRWPSFYSQMRVSIKEDLLGEDLTYVYVNVSQFPGGRLTLAEFDFPDIHLIPGLTYYKTFADFKLKEHSYAH